MTTDVDILTPDTAVIQKFSQSRYFFRTLVLIILLSIFTGYIFNTAGQKQASLLVLGFALGSTLYWATFSFANGWRRAITQRRGIWIRAQMLMLVVASILILPAIATGSLWGNPVFALVRPVGISLLFGAFIFGVGMQIAGSCASGTLYHVGGGQLKMLLVLVTFAIGALVASAHYTWWMEQPSLAPVAWMDHVGLSGAILVNVAIAFAVFWLAGKFEKQRHGEVQPLFNNLKQASLGRSLLLGGLLLAGLNFLTVAIAGRPWSVANAFPVWGAKGSHALGLDLELDFWDYWSQPAMETALGESIFEHMTSIMNIGIILGALAIAIGINRYKPILKIPLRQLIGAVMGGLLLGYGSTIAFGCNIGAFFGGVVSGSLHGWVWFVAAFAGTAFGILLQPLFDMPADDSVISS